MTLRDDRPRRLLVLADTDSYVKWGAALASRLPSGWRAEIAVLASPAAPSPRQLGVALAGSRFAPEDAAVLALDELPARLAASDPDAVLLALRGPFVRVVAPVVARAPRRPVLVSGFPGLTIPAVPKAVVYRELCDLVVLHSRREVREFRALGDGLAPELGFGLATLPFLDRDARRLRPIAAEPVATAASSRSRGDRPAAGEGVAAALAGTDAARRSAARPATVAGWDGGGYRHTGPVPAVDGGDLVFAVQAKVPVGFEERVRLVHRLAEAARADPGRRVVVKVRARRGEAQTHAEAHDLGELVAAMGPAAPANLVVADGPMEAALAAAGALVTVSSTAALEAIARDVPVLLLDDWGVSPEQINTVFVGSGLFGPMDELVAGRFRSPRASWLDDNYFHGPEADDWLERLGELVAVRDAGGLRTPVRRHNLAGGGLRRAWERKRMLGELDRSLAGAVALGVAVPSRWMLRRVRRVLRAARILPV